MRTRWLLASLVSVSPFLSLMASAEIMKIDGAKIWFKVSGKASAPPTMYLHGGPGYNSFTFEKTVGQSLERELGMIYLDQRDCGRSNEVNPGSPVGIDAIVNDIEAIRSKQKIEKLNFIAHSFGGLVALEYFNRHPKRTGKIVLIDISADIAAAFNHQVRFAASVAKQAFPEHHSKLLEIADSNASPMQKLDQTYDLVGRKRLQRELLWATTAAQEKNEVSDEGSGLMEKSAKRLVSHLKKIGYMDSAHPELMGKIGVPAILFSGRHSECIGADNIRSAATKWQIPVVWFEKSGHFSYIEEPDKFVSEAIGFLTN